MSAIFLSHSSRDAAASREVAARLKAQGHRSVFLDFDPEAGIPAGRDWEQELYQQLRVCRAVVILCSRASMASRWCFAEITHAKALGKHVFPLKVEPCEIDPILTSHQVLDLGGDPEDAFQRLWRGLTIAGLDPADAFDWDGRRAPYPGLLAFQEADAAIFFGREREIQEGLEQLQRLRQFGGARLAMVLGASGSGKSSLVRAGLLPRLRRDPDRWLVVDPFRPGEDPLHELSCVLSRTAERLGQPQDARTLRARLHDATEQPVTLAPAPEPSVDNQEERTASEAALAALGELAEGLQKPATPELEARLELLRRVLARSLEGSSRTRPPRPAVAVPGPAAELVELASELRRRTERPEATVLLVIDQFEELLTRPDARPSTHFLEILRGTIEHPASPILILGTLRSDFLGVFQRAPAIVGARFDTLSVGPMAPEAIAQTIERPAALAGLDLEPGLTEALVEDARTEDALPLLAFTLRELWERHGQHGLITAGGRLRIADYREKLGGLSGSVARVADAVLDAAALSEPQQKDLRRVFLKLARLNEEGRFARQPAAWEGLPASVHGVLERFVQARLLVSREEGGGRVLEVAHEALFRSWERLRGWLDQDREFLLWRKRLRAALAQWQETGHDEGALLRGVALAESGRWLAEHGEDLDREERRFIEQSTALRVREEAAMRRRRRQVLVAASSAAGLFLLLALLAWGSFLDARRKSRELQAGLIVKTASTLRDPVASALLLIEAGQLLGGREPPGGARAARQIAGANLSRAVLHGHAGAINTIAWSPDGTRLLTASNDGTARVWPSDGTGKAVVLAGHGDAVRAAAWSPDGRRVATVSADKTARVWSADGSGREVILEGHAEETWGIAWSPDGTRIATTSADKTARVWNADGTGDPIVLEGHGDALRSVAWSPDGRQVSTTSQDATARIWNADGTGTPIVLEGHRDLVLTCRFSHDGRRVATTSRDRTARIWELADPRRPVVLEGHEGWVWNLDWSPDDTRVATASADRTARIWDARGGSDPMVLEGHDDWVRVALWSPDGKKMLTAAHDGEARIWELEGGHEPKLLIGHGGWVRAAAWSPDGRSVATASDDKTVRVWSTASETEPLVLGGHQDQVWSAVFSHDDSRVASTSADRTVKLWRAADGAALATWRGHRDRVRSADWSPDDTLIVTASDDDTARIWPADGSREPIVLAGHDDKALEARFSRDGKKVATGSYDQTVRLWDLAGEPLEMLQGFGGWVRSVAWGPGDEQLLTGSADDAVELRRADGAGEPVLVGRHREQVMSVVWEPAGQRVASASADRSVRIWSLDGKTAPIAFEGHEGFVWSVDWSPDGRKLVSASADWTVRVWNADGTGEPVILDGHEGPVWWAAFSHDGQKIVTASADWTVRIWKLWRLGWVELTTHLRGRTNACLTASERERLLGETHQKAQLRYEECEAGYGRKAAAHEDEP